jgi:hypothetical protein
MAGAFACRQGYLLPGDGCAASRDATAQVHMCRMGDQVAPPAASLSYPRALSSLIAVLQCLAGCMCVCVCVCARAVPQGAQLRDSATRRGFATPDIDVVFGFFV